MTVTDTGFWIIMASAGLVALVVAAAALLSGWRGWLDLRRLEIAARGGMAPTPAARIELADLKERVRRLEAIAAGVEL